MIETEGRQEKKILASMNTTSVRACSANFVSQLVHTMRLRLLQTLEHAVFDRTKLVKTLNHPGQSRRREKKPAAPKVKQQSNL